MTNEQKNGTGSTGRRRFLQNVVGAAAIVAIGSAAQAETSMRPRLGIVTSATGKGGPEAGIAKVHALGFKT